MILSIGLPTFNRCNYLKDTLDCLLPQLVGYENDIELIISDNASQDETKKVVDLAKSKYEFPIAYYRREVGVSGEENFITTCERCVGKYIFLMGDDDILSPNFISIIIPYLKNEEDLAAIHWNRLTGDKDCSNNALVDKTFQGNAVEILNSKDFVMRVMEKPNFMSSIIFKKEMLEKGKAYYQDKYFGYRFFAQMYFGILLSGGNCLYYYFPLVIQRNPNKSWAKYWPQYFVSSSSNIFKDMDKFVPGIYAQWSIRLRNEIPRFIPSVSRYRDYYRQPAIKKLIFSHMTKKEIIKYNYYLLPGSLFFYRAKKRLLTIINQLLG